MRKGFTLAEILIVLTIIGVMAVMTIPSLIQNSNSQQKIAKFKKGFNVLSNAYATEFTIKAPPVDSSRAGKKILQQGLINQLNSKYFYHKDTKNKIYDKDLAINTVVDSGWPAYWIYTEDGIAYRISGASGYSIGTKLQVNSQKNTYDYMLAGRLCILVDINGPDGPNRSCHHDENKEYWDSMNLDKLDCDTAMFCLSKEGLTSGNPDCTISGRIISGVNPRAAYCEEQ